MAGRLDIASEVFSLIREHFEDIKGPRTHGNLWRAISYAVHKHQSEHFQHDVVLTQHAIGTQVLEREHDQMMASWRRYDPGYQVILGTFDDQGSAILYFVGLLEGQKGRVHLIQFPGHCAIGTGAYNASFWLNYREQNFGMPLRQCALHAYEACLMASSAPTVNSKPDILIANHSEAFCFSKERPPVGESPISFAELESLAKRYGPRSTRSLRRQPNNLRRSSLVQR